MDIKRPKQNKALRRVGITAVILVVVVGITVGVSRLKPAAPTVERSTVWVDTVKRGEMLRQVRGLGTLVPEDVRLIPAAYEGRVDHIRVRPGAIVAPDTILIELSNPELEQSVRDAELQLKVAEAEAASLKVRLENERLDLQSAYTTVQANFTSAKMRSDANETLAKEGLISELTRKESQVSADELAARREVEKKRIEIKSEAVNAQIAAQNTRIEQLRALAELRKSQLDALRVRAGMNGVVQIVPVVEGQRVTVGTNLARLADPSRLKAEVRIAETQAKDIVIGLPASIDTRNGVVNGRVTRIDPSVQAGTVTVDVAMEGDLPKGARPDLSVDGVIELERLTDIVYVGRPVQGQANSQIGIFKLEADGVTAVRIPVKLGRSSVNTIEIVEGLQPGDQVILSDMSAWDAYNRIQLK